MSTNVLKWFRPASTAPDGDRARAEWWRDRLITRLDERIPHLKLLDDYYRGKHAMEFASPQFAQTFGELFKDLSDNWMEIVVQSSLERLSVVGFRFGGPGPDMAAADDAAWEIWQRNHMDAEHVAAMETAIKLGVAYAFVGAENGKAVINIDHPADAITEPWPTRPRVVRYGLRRWVEETGRAVVVLADADRTWRWEQARGDRLDLVGVEDNALGVVPMVPILNNPRDVRHDDGRRERVGVSDIEQLLGLNDAIDKLVMDMLVASEYAAFRQRYVTGMDIPVDPETGERLVTEWKSAISRLWIAEDKDTRFGEFTATDLDNYVKGVGMLLQHLSAQSRTPPHYLIGQIVNASGDALKAAETGLVAKVTRKQMSFGDDWEDVMRLAFLVEDDQERAQDWSAETIWADCESRSQAEVTDSLLKLKAIGVPLEVVLEKGGYTPQEIQRIKQMQAEDALRTVMDRLGGPNDQGDPTLGLIEAA